MDWFQRLWLERRTGWAARKSQDQGAVVFLGDSITQGWAGLGGVFPGLKVANRGISGDTTRGVLYRLREDVLTLQPRAVVLLIGTNDLEEMAEPEVASSNVALILDALLQHQPTLPVVLCAVFPSAASKKRPSDKIIRLNQLLFALLKERPQVTFLDTWALFAGDKGDARAEEFPDLLHPNARAYLKWGRALRPILETLQLVPAWPDDFAPEPGFSSLFNGRDLSGWSYLDQPLSVGGTATPDERFVVRNGRLVVTVSRLLRAYARLQTIRTYPRDFELRLEFRASPNADSGVFVRGPQLQCRDFLIAGPYLDLQRYRPLDWNELIVTVRGGLAGRPAMARCWSRRSRCRRTARSGSKATTDRSNTDAFVSKSRPEAGARFRPIPPHNRTRIAGQLVAQLPNPRGGGQGHIRRFQPSAGFEDKSQIDQVRAQTVEFGYDVTDRSLSVRFAGAGTSRGRALHRARRRRAPFRL
jgi:lysophospholipase L1-like esterase